MAEEKLTPASFPHKSLLIGFALVGLLGLGLLVILMPRSSCEGIFQQTAPKMGAHLEIIKNKGSFAVSHEKIQELSENAQKVGLHLKTCCSVLEHGKLNPEQFQQCLDKASTYDRKIALVAKQLTEAAEAKVKGAVEIVDNKIVNIKQIIQTATKDAEDFAKEVSQIRPSVPVSDKGHKMRGQEIEPNNTAAQATELRLSGEISAEVSATKDIDYYRLVSTKQLRDLVSIKLQNFSESLRPNITLYNQKKSKIDNVHDNTYGADIEYQFTAEPDATYFIKVDPWDSTGKYKIIAVYRNAHDNFEPNDTAGKSTTLGPGKIVTANIMDQRDLDWYRLIQAPAATVHVKLQNRSSTLRPSVKIYDEKRSKILEKHDDTLGASLNFTFDATPGKEYYIAVYPWDTSGSYELSVN